jgi:D-sedoheptulose 7-phosphate isomerase
MKHVASGAQARAYPLHGGIAANPAAILDITPTSELLTEEEKDALLAPVSNPADRIYESHLIEHKRLFEVMLMLRHDIEATAQLIARCLASGNKVLLCGNGGSASDAQHFAAELTGRFMKNRPALAAMALSANAAVLTCIGNDFGFDEIYARQVEAFGAPGDCLVAISTSGNSENVVRAVKAARRRGVTTIALTGEDGKINRMCEQVMAVPASSTARIQEAHIFIIHTLCALVETHLNLN